MVRSVAKKLTPMWVTGISTTKRRKSFNGFTLIEILVVLLIIGIMITGAVLTTGVVGGDRDLDQERDRILALSTYLRDQAALQNREYGMRCFVGGYEFLVYEPRVGQWQRLEGDEVARRRALPQGVTMELIIEGRRVVLPKADVDDAERAPQIMLFSSGELNLFELILRREPDNQGFKLTPATDSLDIQVTAWPTGA
jgi:general secretion pathway protein H